MPIIATTSGSDFEKVPPGNHIARCYSMIEIGTEQEEFEGKKKSLYRVRISWELPNEKRVFDESKGEQPFSIAKDYTLSMFDRAALRQDLESWRGKAFTDEEAKAFDITKLIGVPCLLNVIHKASKMGKTYARISSVAPVPKGTTIPAQINPSFIFSFDEWDDQKFAALPKWLKERIEATPEFNKHLSSGNGQHVDAGSWEAISANDEPLPF